MAQLVTKTIAGLYNGVSRQSPALRLDNQGEEQVNCIGYIEQGLVRRPAVEFYDQITKEVSSTDKVFFINRSDTEKYFVAIRDDQTEPIVVYDFVNKELKQVQYGHLDQDLNFTPDDTVKSYLLTGTESPLKRFHTLTVADYTIITNREVVASLTSDKTSPKLKEWYVWFSDVLSLGGGTKTISITCYGPATATATKTYDSYTTVNPLQLAMDLGPQLDGVWGYSCEISSSCLRIWREDGEDFEIHITEPSGGASVKALPMEARKFNDLFPAYLFPGRVFRIVVDNYEKFVGYYVESDGRSWNETCGWDILYKVDETTMPHRLVRMSDGSFVFADIEWAERLVGDNETAPIPSFFGKQISSTFFFSNRFGILAGDTVVLSAVADYWNFWPATVLDILDDDPIDLGVAVNDVVHLNTAVPYNKQLLILANKQQFVLNSDPMLTPKTAAISQTTAFPCDQYSDAILVGSNVYFMSPTTTSMHVLEYFIQPDSYVDDAANVTIHVADYLPLGQYNVVDCSELDVLFFFTPETPDTLYVYKYYWLGNEKPQSEWCKWTFNYEIRGLTSDRDKLILWFQNSIIGVLPLRPSPHITLSTGESYCCYLDFLSLQTGVFDGEYTTWTLPFIPNDLERCSVVDPDTGLALTQLETVEPDILRISGDYSSKPYLVGEVFTSLYEFSRWFLKNKEGNLIKGRLQYRTLTLEFDQTGFFEVQVEAKDRDIIKQSSDLFTYMITGSSILGEAVLQSGKFKALIMANAETTRVLIVSDTHFPFIIHTAHLEGYYHERSRLI